MKKSILALNGKEYHNIIAENYLCVPAVLETVINAEQANLTSINKYDIANFFGIVLPSGLEYDFLKNYSYSDDPKNFGVILKINSVNSLFSFFNIPLLEFYCSINSINSDFFSDYIYDYLKQNTSLICGFDYNFLYNICDEYCGHVSIIIDVDTRNETVTLLDPGPKYPGKKVVNALSLYSAIKKASDGLWIIKKIKKEAR